MWVIKAKKSFKERQKSGLQVQSVMQNELFVWIKKIRICHLKSQARWTKQNDELRQREKV